jgi:hypothetical protein
MFVGEMYLHQLPYQMVEQLSNLDVTNNLEGLELILEKS